MKRRTIGDLQIIAPRLNEWYRRERRLLPWRGDSDPYRVWIAEVMLQQTQVGTVIPYYQRFLERFPDARALAAATEDEVLESWAGLGYYSRGRRLRQAALRIVRDHGGRFPRDVTRIRTLPGIGDYTTAAIASIAFGDAIPVIDGNVERVLCRFLALEGDPRRSAERRELRAAAVAALDQRDPGTHNQALMELGATVCRPRAPRCPECPLELHCAGRQRGDPQRFPPARRRPPPETQVWIAAVVTLEKGTLVRKTPRTAPLLPGHWGVPLRRLTSPAAPEARDARRAAREEARAAFGVTPRGGRLRAEVRHGITYRRLRIHPVYFSLDGISLPRSVRVLAPAQIPSLAALFRKIVERCR